MWSQAVVNNGEIRSLLKYLFSSEKSTNQFNLFNICQLTKNTGKRWIDSSSNSTYTPVPLIKFERGGLISNRKRNSQITKLLY